jgi:hypothetical protein
MKLVLLRDTMFPVCMSEKTLMESLVIFKTSGTEKPPSRFFLVFFFFYSEILFC